MQSSSVLGSYTGTVCLSAVRFAGGARTVGDVANSYSSSKLDYARVVVREGEILEYIDLWVSVSEQSVAQEGY